MKKKDKEMKKKDETIRVLIHKNEIKNNKIKELKKQIQNYERKESNYNKFNLIKKPSSLIQRKNASKSK